MGVVSVYTSLSGCTTLAECIENTHNVSSILQHLVTSAKENNIKSLNNVLASFLFVYQSCQVYTFIILTLVVLLAVFLSLLVVIKIDSHDESPLLDQQGNRP